MPKPETRNRNWLLILSRRWHTWLGLAVSLVAISICATGFYLNHKNLFHGRAPAEAGSSGLLRTTTALARMPVGFDDALAVARRHWGDVAVENVQLKAERGALVYKVKAAEGRELTVDALSGRATVQEGYALREHAAGGALAASSTNWSKLLMDVHTGKVLGGPGRLLVDFTSFVLVVLTCSGIYLWIVPKLRKRAALARAADGATRIAAAIPAEPASR